MKNILMTALIAMSVSSSIAIARTQVNGDYCDGEDYCSGTCYYTTGPTDGYHPGNGCTEVCGNAGSGCNCPH